MISPRRPKRAIYRRYMKSKRFFLWKDTLSTIAVKEPERSSKWDNEWEVTMRDCSRQIHWLFPETRKGVAKARKVAKFFNELLEALESKVGK